MLALHLLQSALVLVNTRLVDRVLAEPDWAGPSPTHDRRGLTPLFWSNVPCTARSSSTSTNASTTSEAPMEEQR